MQKCLAFEKTCQCLCWDHYLRQEICLTELIWEILRTNWCSKGHYKPLDTTVRKLWVKIAPQKQFIVTLSKMLMEWQQLLPLLHFGWPGNISRLLIYVEFAKHTTIIFLPYPYNQSITHAISNIAKQSNSLLTSLRLCKY